MSIMKCNICGNQSFKNVYISPDDFKVLECTRCGLLFQPEIHEYKEDYYKKQHKNYFFYEKVRPDYIKAFNKINKNNGKLLDLGCGTGVFLEYVKKNFWNGKGIELSKYCVKICKNKGLDVLQCDILNFETKEKFDVISILDALDHFQNPSLLISKCKRWLKDDGVILLTVTNHDQPFNFIRNKIFTKHHLFFFTPKSITDLARKHHLSCYIYIENPPVETMDKYKNMFRFVRFFINIEIVGFLYKKGKLIRNEVF